MELIATTKENLEEIAPLFLPFFEKNKIFALKGEMGVGKTTFISYLAHAMKIQDPVSSPTYGYVNEYFSPIYGKVYHLDLYRIENIEDAYNIGIEEYLYNENAVVFIEWAEIIEKILPENCIWVKMSKNNIGVRKIEIGL